jgi:glycosyltransferase involved in cell wall biosynthesis
MGELQDGRTNILFVGRIAANKKQDDLVRAFGAYRTLDPEARLILVGTVEERDPYADHLREIIANSRFASSVEMRGGITERELLACYYTADLFWSMSEHEGFCAPLVEAMWFDVPVLARRSSAVPETLGDSALLFNDEADLCCVAALAAELASGTELRLRVIRAQRNRRSAFDPAPLALRLKRVVETLYPVMSMAS